MGEAENLENIPLPTWAASGPRRIPGLPQISLIFARDGAWHVFISLLCPPRSAVVFQLVWEKLTWQGSVLSSMLGSNVSLTTSIN